MMKQYDFPRIFQNVVGEVIPPSLRNRDMPLHQKQNFRPQELMSSSCNTSEPPNPAHLYVHSKKKKLVRRLKFNKTSSCFSAKNALPQEEKLSQNGSSPLLRNFLKRKQLTLQKTEKLSSRLEKDEIFEKAFFLEDEMRSDQAQGVSIHRTSNPRVRTSFNYHLPLDKEKNGKDTHHPPKQRASQLKSMPYSHKSHDTQFTVRSKPKHRTFFKFDIISQQRQHQKIDQPIRKKSKKKTVNFMINSQKENQQGQSLPTDSPRRGTKMQRTFVQKSSKFNGINKDPNGNNGSRLDLSECSSNWSAKSVISIKLTSNQNIKINSKRTLRSQQSIFEDNSRFMIKITDNTSRYRTRTYIKFPYQHQISLKNYKSLTSLSQVSIDINSDWSINKTKRKQQRNNTNKPLASSKKMVEKQGKKMKNKVSILVKTNAYIFNDSQRTIEPIKGSTFQELVFKRNNTLFKASRAATDPDIFGELNNFHKFLHQNSIQDDQHDLQRTITKPIVIDTAVGHRMIHSSRLQTEENLMFDMGLTLLKKMSVLRQKKL